MTNKFESLISKALSTDSEAEALACIKKAKTYKKHFSNERTYTFRDRSYTSSELIKILNEERIAYYTNSDTYRKLYHRYKDDYYNMSDKYEKQRRAWQYRWQVLTTLYIILGFLVLGGFMILALSL